MSGIKRILHVVSCLELGGTETFIMNNYRNIDRSRYQFDFLVFAQKEYPYAQEIKQLGGNVYYAIQPSLLHFFRFYKAFRNAVKSKGRYYAIHCHANAGNAVPLLCAFLCGIKKRVSHSHDTNQKPKSFFKKLVFALRRFCVKTMATDYIACSCEAGYELYGEHFFQHKGIIINNGINVQDYLAANVRKDLISEFNIDDSVNFICGNISRFEPKKNQMFIVDVFSHLLKYNPMAVLLLGGVDGGQLDAVKAKVKELDLENNVRFIGKRQDIPDCLALIDVYLFPSLYEGLGIALLEAQAAGCLCFASDGVSKESDMGLGTAHYYSLDLGADIWAEKINNELKLKHEIPDDEILLAFRKKGYDIVDSSKKLVRIYEG